MSVLQNSSLTRRKRIEVLSARPKSSKKPKMEMYQNRIRLPRIYKFILIPQNGTEDYDIPNPRQNTPLYTELENMHMIQTITFTQGDEAYCRQQVVTAFHRFPLEEWKFYRANGRSTLIHAEMYDCQTFDLIQLAEYLFYFIFLIVDYILGKKYPSAPTKNKIKSTLVQFSLKVSFRSIGLVTLRVLLQIIHPRRR